jgi:hypothetical protein
VKFFKILAFITAMALMGCTSINQEERQRSVASSVEEGSLSGTQLGVARYYWNWQMKPKYDGKREKWQMKYRAVRAYFNKIEGETDSYHAIVLEYTDLRRMAAPYIGSNKLPAIQWIFGFLKRIAAKVSVYKVTPRTDSGTYEMQLLKAEGGQLVSDKSDDPSVLHLSKRNDLVHPLSGARMTKYTTRKGHDVDVFFPIIPKTETKKEAKQRKKESKFGIQYNLANFVYNKMKLESTWRMSYLTGPYLRAYNDKKHNILNLSKSEGKLEADFKIEKSNFITKRGKARRFTNKKSAEIEGKYTVTEPANGIFIFTANDSNSKGREHVENRLGVFVDIFDATKSLNQDVVELIMVDSENPTDFLMYYEHPDNGEGEKKVTK